MAKIVGSGNQWVYDFCEAIGEKPSDIGSIVLIIKPDDVVHIEIRKFVNDEDEKIIELIRKVAWITESVESEK